MPDTKALFKPANNDNTLFLRENMRDRLQILQRIKYNSRDQLEQVRSILGLISCIQRHRGATMALLGGDNRFANRLNGLQIEITLRIEGLLLEPEQAVDSNDKDNILSAWKTIALNWQDDTVLENFEYHSHLIEYLLRMVRTRGDQYIAGINELAGVLDDPALMKSLTALNFLACMNIPDCFELLAKLRGHATHAAASNHCDPFTKSRIEFYLKELGRLIARFDSQVRDLGVELQEKLVPGSSLAQTKVKRDYFINLLSNEIVENAEINLDSEMVYRVSSEVIDTYSKFSESILTYLACEQPLLVERFIKACAINTN